MLMLIIGGAGYLYGGLIGAATFIVLRDVISAATPEYWEFWIGALLVALVLIGRERVRDAVVRTASLVMPKPPAGARRDRAGARSAGPQAAIRRAARRRRRLVRLQPGARQALIGPNGAGKTTLINLLTGIVRPAAGQVILQGRDVTGLSPSARVRLGLSRTFQINQLFPHLTPAEFAWARDLGTQRRGR